MTLLVIENYPRAGPASLGRIAAAAGFDLTTVHAYAGGVLPDNIAGFGGLIVLGGAQDALADEAYPHLRPVCGLIRQFHEADRPVLGICLGCQLVARAFGGGNILGRPVEFGWHTVTPTRDGQADPVLSALKGGGPMFHWHTDTVALPEGAVHLAQSAMTPNQAFRLGRATYGIQFHFEAAEEDVRSWSRDLIEDIRPHTPDWPQRLDGEAARHAREADAFGAALSAAWLGLVRQGGVTGGQGAR